MQEQEEQLAKAFKLLVNGFITYPEDCELEAEEQGPRGIYAVVKCNRADRSRLIGKAGRNARAMQEILKAVAFGVGSRTPFRYTVLEPWRGVEEPESPYKVNERWSKENTDGFIAMVQKTLDHFDKTATITARDPIYGQTVVTIATYLEYGAALQTSLGDIFSAIGRSAGREIKIEYVNGDSPVQSSGLLARQE